MAEIFSELNTSFTTADTVGPVSLCFDGDELACSFRSFGTELQTVVFHDVRTFSWTGWDGAPIEAGPDRVYYVRESAILAPWQGFNVDGHPFLHFKLGFNAEARFLDVIATRMEHRDR